MRARGERRRGDVGLDGARAEARHLDHVDRAAVPVPRPRGEPARHARPPRLLRGHLPRARRRRRRGHGARRGEGHRAADAQAVRGVPRPRACRCSSFINKWDRPGRLPLELLDEIERQIGVVPTPVTWPVGIRRRLPGRGRPARRTGSSASPAPPAGPPRRPRRWSTPSRAADEEGAAWTVGAEELGLLDAVGADFDVKSFLAGRRRPCSSARRSPTSACASCSTRSSTSCPRRRRATTTTGSPATSTRRSRASCSRCRRTWTRRTATASPSCGCARGRFERGMVVTHGPHRQAVRHEVRPLGVRPGA